MLFRRIALTTMLLSCTAVHANTAPSYHYIQASVERISQSGEENFSNTGLGLNAAWQLNSNWFLATEWQRFSEKRSDTFQEDNLRADISSEMSLNRYYLGAGYILPLSEVTNISFAGYFGAYRYALKSNTNLFTDNQLSSNFKNSLSTTDNSIKTQIMLRANINSQLELSGRVYYEYLNDSDLDNKSQYGVGAGALYQLNPRFALSADLSTGKLLDEGTTQIGVGARYQF
ncbi:outer membrane beta-barrel protein [Arsukibacterium sp.]|uniref:outer membrane beta-barrel protein n=1 Tax=Arsukibacterium sp. TaxID=1977258 RepID=UPI002FD9CBEA